MTYKNLNSTVVSVLKKTPEGETYAEIENPYKSETSTIRDILMNHRKKMEQKLKIIDNT